MNRIAIYCRVSTADQDTATQQRILEQYAKTRHWKYKTFTEVQSTRNTRPVKQQVLHALRTGTYTGVLVYKLDRWARSSRELILEIKELLDKDIMFVSVTDNIDLATASGKLHFHIISAFAEFERDLISERTKAGLARKKATGTKLGRPPGSKDKRQRVKSGYYLRELNKRNNDTG